MSIGPVVVFSPSTEPQVESGKVRVPQTPRSFQGSGSDGENGRQQSAPSVSAIAQDEVKVQWYTSDRVMIYQFLNQQGGLILQVPSDQLLSLARQISKEVVTGAVPELAVARHGETNGH